ncbi:MAG: protein-L-isoaspartate(D-aspartate) O-methyltransferase [Elusimicrobia bacterium]|nr:protein-L-isoaspartate(D-aspartate) O-methyltransferase [Elusimicrobiota bacterium]
MVETQIESRAICDENVLNAMKKIPRHLFVDSHFGAAAYGDWPLPIGEGQTISQPYIVALMTELLCVGSSSRILEIGTGSGYQAAVLAEIVEKVYTIEIVPSLSQKAQKTLDGLGYGNVKFKIGDGFLGWPEYAPYDGILVTCAPTEIPQPLLDQLADGGRLVIPVGDYFQRLKIVERRSGQIKIFENIPVRFVPMTGISQGKNGK